MFPPLFPCRSRNAAPAAPRPHAAPFVLALLFGLTGTLLLSGAGHVLIELGGGPMALARYEAAWRETIRPLLIAATLVAYAVAATLGLGGCPAAREAPFLDGR